MNQVSSRLRRCTLGYGHWCPACEEMHVIPDTWTFDRNLECPSFNPSVKITGTRRLTDAEIGRILGGEKLVIPQAVCHYTLTKGIVAYHNDSTHNLAGATVPLPPLPEGYTDDPNS